MHKTLYSNWSWYLYFILTTITISSSSPSRIPVLPLLLLLKLPHLTCIQYLYLGFPLLIVPSQNCTWSDLHLCWLKRRIITQRYQIPGRFFDVQQCTILYFHSNSPTILPVILQLLSNLMRYLHHKLAIQIQLPKYKSRSTKPIEQQSPRDWHSSH